MCENYQYKILNNRDIDFQVYALEYEKMKGEGKE